MVSKPQMRWLVGEHRVVVRRRVLVVDVVAVHGDLVARLPVAHRRADAQHDARRRRSRRRGTAGRGARPTRSPCRGASRNPNVGSGSKIDVHTVLKLIAAGHHRDVRLVGRELGQRELLDVQRLARVLVARTARPANISCSSARTRAPRTASGSGSAPSSSPGAPSRMAVRMASISVVMAGDRSAASAEESPATAPRAGRR